VSHDASVNSGKGGAGWQSGAAGRANKPLLALISHESAIALDWAASSLHDEIKSSMQASFSSTLNLQREYNHPYNPAQEPHNCGFNPANAKFMQDLYTAALLARHHAESVCL
jgi:hypothetical protein